MSVYKSVEKQTIYDVCLQTYGSLDLLNKLITENSIDSIDIDIISGTSFIWDEKLVIDQKRNQTLTDSNIIMATKL